MTTPKLFWFFTLVVLLLQAVLAYSDFPDQMVTHMGIDGTPDAYGAKAGFFLSLGLGVLVINIMPPLVPLLMNRLPEGLVNLPNKEYWFADARRKCKAIDQMFSMMTLVMGMVNVMFIVVVQQTVDLSMGRTPLIPFWMMWVILPLILTLPLIYLLVVLRVPKS